MKSFIQFGVLLMIVGLVSCSGSTEGNPPASPSTADPVSSETPDSHGLPTATDEPTATRDAAAPKTTTSKQFSDAPDRDLFRLTKELVPGTGHIARTVPRDPEDFTNGRIDTFWLMDLANTGAYQSDFELVLVTPHAYWYVERDLSVGLSAIERSALKFEEEIYPVVTQVFGNEWRPGIDNDPHLSILNAKLTGVGGYFSSTDEYPTDVRPRSNQRETIYINALNVAPGGADYDEVLAHELQHAIHWKADASEDTWVNEGLSELSTSIALDTPYSIGQFLRGPPTSLVNWPVSTVGGLSNYGASSLFMHFLTEHYGGRSDLRALLSQPEDGIAGIDAYLAASGYESRFEDVFRDWSAANIVDGSGGAGNGALGYNDLDVMASVSRKIEGFKEFESDIPQFSVEYTELESISHPSILRFNGDTTTRLLPVDIGPTGCWWSNSGDSIDSTLAHRVELPSGTTASLDYEVWHEIEENWDFVYVEVSVDGGQTWQIIETPATSPENPIGSGFGSGYTGDSNGWIKESIDLVPFFGENFGQDFAGQVLWVRFQYVTDDAINGSGACFRGLSIDGAAITEKDEEWEAQGFAFVDNKVRQDFQVQLITLGAEPVVRQMRLDADNTGELTILPPQNGERIIVAVGSLAEKTRQSARYALNLAPVE